MELADGPSLSQLIQEMDGDEVCYPPPPNCTTCTTSYLRYLHMMLIMILLANMILIVNPGKMKKKILEPKPILLAKFHLKMETLLINLASRLQWQLI